MGEHHDLAAVPALLENSWFAHSESMDLTNDPRFFTGNVVDKRLDAFSQLSVISGLMVGVALSEANSMKKDILWSHYNHYLKDATLQLVGFFSDDICSLLQCRRNLCRCGTAISYIQAHDIWSNWV